MHKDCGGRKDAIIAPVFDNAAILIRIVGEQTGPDAALVRQRMARLLLEHECKPMLIDLRFATYVSSLLQETVERLVVLASAFPAGRVAIWHRNEDSDALSSILHAFRRAGHLAAPFVAMDAARDYLLAGGEADTVELVA